MPTTWRRAHRRAISEASLGSSRPVVVRRHMPGDLQRGTFRVMHPPSFATTRAMAAAPYRYAYVRGHVVKTPQKAAPRSHATQWAHDLNDALRSRRGNICEVCSQVPTPFDPLQWAHIAETGLSGMGRGQVWRMVDVRDHPEKYALMCKRCHGEFDTVLGPVAQADVRRSRQVMKELTIEHARSVATNAKGVREAS